MVEPGAVAVTFQLSEGSQLAWATVESGGVRAKGFWPLAGETFRLRREATALGDHVHLLVDSPVAIRLVSRAGIAVGTSDWQAKLEGLDTRASCNALAFDPFFPDHKAPPDLKGEIAVPVGKRLGLRTSPVSDVAFILENDPPNALFIEMKVLARMGDRARVGFTTEHARFDVWVNAAEIQVEDIASGALGGAELGCMGRMGGASGTSELIEDADAIIADWPSQAGTANVRFKKGARVYAGSPAGEWVSVTPVASAIRAPDNLDFWIPARALE